MVAYPLSSSLAIKCGLNNSKAIFLGNPHSSILKVGPTTITERPEKSTRFPRRFCLKRPCFPLIISLSDLSGRLLAPFTALARRPLSNNASTDSCNIRFSLRTIISGASSSTKRLRRWLRLITRRYKSFTSETANLPPSSDTSGRKSGGRTGKTVSIIHAGLFPEFKNDSITLRRLLIVFFFASDFVSPSASLRVVNKSTKSIDSSKSRITSPPIRALKPSSPNL